MRAKIVIGANFGDEGKGLTSAFLTDDKSIIVKCNGGAQAGHTVVSEDDIRHVFHHFGSGTIKGAPTYLSHHYIVNPILFRSEYEELVDKGITPVCYIDRECRITTPYEMILNQMAERSRNNSKHGSCGLGIYETIRRDNNIKIRTYDKDFKDLINRIRSEYIKARIKELNIEKIYYEYKDIINSDILIENYMEDYFFMLNHVIITDEKILSNYENIIFECAQGLLLDMNNEEYAPNLTPSNTGSKNPIEILDKLDCTDVSVYYVTRTYFTRHGAGRFESECSKADINDTMYDMTNVPNEFQETLRYGYFDEELIKKQINKDLGNYRYKVNKNIVVTHLNETGNMIVVGKDKYKNIEDIFSDFVDDIYISNSEKTIEKLEI